MKTKLVTHAMLAVGCVLMLIGVGWILPIPECVVALVLVIAVIFGTLLAKEREPLVFMPTAIAGIFFGLSGTGTDYLGYIGGIALTFALINLYNAKAAAAIGSFAAKVAWIAAMMAVFLVPFTTIRLTRTPVVALAGEVIYLAGAFLVHRQIKGERQRKELAERTKLQ